MKMRMNHTGVVSRGSRRGFTLVELLVVIAIIGVLVGLALPGVLAARRTFNNAAGKMEVNGIADAIEKYRNKYGDYPPDGSSWPVMEQHLRKAFPEILASELAILNPANNSVNSYIRNDYDTTHASLPQARVMDPAEALVFFLGGFSSDKQKPLSGKGGPFVSNGTVYTYNTSRANAQYEFKADRLMNNDGDLLPVFLAYGNREDNEGNPYVYFDSRTYFVNRGANIFFNYHVGQGNGGAARPMLEEKNPVNYALLKTYQIVGPGMDKCYGGKVTNDPTQVVLFAVAGKGYMFDFMNKVFTAAPQAVSPLSFTLSDFAGKKFMNDNNTNANENSTLQ